MDRVQILLVGLPLLLFCSDLFHLFTPRPPPPHHHHHHPHHPHPHPHHHHPHPHPHPHHHLPPHLQRHEHLPEQSPVTHRETLKLLPQKEDDFGGIGLGNNVHISFCSSCSYRGNAETMKKMLETAFPGISVDLANYPPAFPKRVLGKLVPVAQIGVVGLIMAGEHIFPLLGLMTPPPWYYSLRANRFGTIAATLLLGNALQSSLQSTGAFEVFLNNELVFSKLKEGRFPGEIELKDVVGRRLANSRIDGAGALWS
ncbi:hypothetical protein UlMin_013169 [Ulmus minor]